MMLESLALGLTKCLNHFHNPAFVPSALLPRRIDRTNDPSEVVEWFLKLRELQEGMDKAVLDAYGWRDLDPEYGFHEVEYLPENDRIRYTISERTRKEVLRRLLTLNHERHEEEVKNGLWDEKKGKRTKKSNGPGTSGDQFELGV
jgi:hypothetical protein